jgi:hypothetical protein
MEWQIIVALLVAIPVILFPAAFIWYLNVGGIFEVVREALARRTFRSGRGRATRKPVAPGMATGKVQPASNHRGHEVVTAPFAAAGGTAHNAALRQAPGHLRS